MSRRARALAFLALAVLAAAAAASVAGGYGSAVSRGYGPLRRVVVLAADLPGRRRIGAGEVTALTQRRVPARFVPPGTLSAPREALGLVPATALPAGSYLLAAQLRLPRRPGPARRMLAGGRRPVQISVSGAGALLAAGPVGPGARVDVVVTSEPGGGGRGRTYVAAAAVPLLALAPPAEAGAAGGLAEATLGLTRRQALRLIAAESFARRVTLLPGA